MSLARRSRRLLLGVALVVAAASDAGAFPGIRRAFNNLYPAQRGTLFDGTGRSQCGVCHRSSYGFDVGGERNAYGHEIEEQFVDDGGPCSNASCAIQNAASLDSDGDGVTNGDEIAALTWPGYSNANCPPDANWKCEAVGNASSDADGDGWTPAAGDCNDDDAKVHPNATDYCGDDRDSDCDGVDEDCQDLAAAVKVPREFKVELFATGLELPVYMAVGPDGRIYVAEHTGRVRTLDGSHGLPATVTTFAEDLYQPYGIAFGPNDGKLYVSENNGQIERFTDSNADGVADSRETFVSGICNFCFPFSVQGLAFDVNGDLLVGAAGGDVYNNVFLRITPGGSMSVVATGIRNPTDITRTLDGHWVAPDNGPESNDELNEIVEGSDYGWPTYWGEPPPASGTVAPIQLYPKGEAPTGITTYTGSAWCGYEGDAFISFFHSDAFADPKLKGKIERVKLATVSGSVQVVSTEHFATRLDTPMDVAFDAAGRMYIDEYWPGLVFRVSPRDTDGDGQLDVCDTNDDNDALPDASDNCPAKSGLSQVDQDGDGIGDACDNCPSVANPDQADLDLTNYGDACEPRACGSFAELGMSGTAASAPHVRGVRTVNLALYGAGPLFAIWLAGRRRRRSRAGAGEA